MNTRSIVGLGLVLGLLIWWLRRDDPEALGRALVLAEKVAPYDAPSLSPDELEQFERDVSGLSKWGVKKVSEALEPPPDDAGTAKIMLLGYPMVKEVVAWERPMEILAARMIELDPEGTFREAFWRIKWTDRFSVTFIELLATRSPDFVWQEMLRFYDEAWEHHDTSIVMSSFGYFQPIFRSYENIEGKPGRAYLRSGEFRGKPYSEWLEREAQMGMLRHAEEQGELIEFLEWKLDEGLELSDEMSSHYFRIEHVPRFEIPCLALALLAKEDPEKAIRWAANHTMKFDFDWRATIVSGWIEYYPPDRESIPKFESKHEDSLNWLLRTVEAGNRGLTSAFYQWYYDQDIEALRWLAEPAVGPPEEEVKAALRAEFLK